MFFTARLRCPLLMLTKYRAADLGVGLDRAQLGVFHPINGRARLDNGVSRAYDYCSRGNKQ